MGCLLVIPLIAALAAFALHIGAFMGFFLASLAAVTTSLAGLLGLVLLW
jgi:hypothetical protein